MPDILSNIRPLTETLPATDPLNAKTAALMNALEAVGIQGQVNQEIGRFATPVSVYESLQPLRALALARTELLLRENNELSLPGMTVKWYRDPLNASSLGSIIPLAMSSLRRSLFDDALGGKVGNPGSREAILKALEDLTTELAAPPETAVLECRATATVDGKPGGLSSWVLTSATKFRFLALHITSFGESHAPSPGDA